MFFITLIVIFLLIFLFTLVAYINYYHQNPDLFRKTSIVFNPTSTNVKKTMPKTIARITNTPSIAKITNTPSIAKITNTPSIARITNKPSIPRITNTPSIARITNTPSIARITNTPSITASMAMTTPMIVTTTNNIVNYGNTTNPTSSTFSDIYFPSFPPSSTPQSITQTPTSKINSPTIGT